MALGPAVRALPILISISALGSGNACLFSAARYCVAGAQYGYLPEVFACIHKRRLTPMPSVVFQGLVAIALCIPSNVEGLIDFFSFAAWIFYGLTFTATLCCKFTMKNIDRVISVSPHSIEEKNLELNISGSYSIKHSDHSHFNLFGSFSSNLRSQYRICRCFGNYSLWFSLLLSIRIS